MKFVQPIKDDEVVEGIKDHLRIQSVRNYLLFCMGIYSGLRVSDLLNLRVGMVRNKTHVMVREQKNNKNKKFILHPSYREVLDIYIASMNDDEYLFASRQQKTKSRIRGKPIHRTTAYKMLNKAADRFGLTEVGCHTMRKTWGYRLYAQNPANLAFLMEMFNHSKQTTTLRYLGLTQDAMDRAILNLS
ncbi:site-specific tyrosine recombinase XerD [compost metagenome]